MTHYSADAPLGWVVRGAKDSEEIEEGASRVSKVPVAGPVPTTELVAEEDMTIHPILWDENLGSLNNLQYLTGVWEEVFSSVEDGAGIGLPKLGERFET
ncbi:hypothetical protein BHM03_00057160 [Ensete ventricosum]|nr:hypothetical protein BHM03_00057160 [Ensete ventricosum]